MLLVEPELFDYLKEFYYPDLQKSQNQFANYDCLSKEHKHYIELKSRNTHYDNLVIEQIKYDAIVQAAVFLGYAPIYINCTPEGIYKFDLSTLPTPQWSGRMLPRNTEFNNKTKVNKVVGYLPIKDGEKL